MHLKYLLLLTGLLLSIFNTAYAVPPIDIKTLEKIRQEALADDFAYHKVEALTTQFGARMAGTNKEQQALNWLQQELIALGIQDIKKQAVQARNWRRKSAQAEVLAPYNHQLEVVSLGGSIPTPITGIEAKVVRFSSLDHLQNSNNEDVQGKIVYLARKLNPEKTANDYLKAVRLRQKAPIIAAQKGALAVIIRSITTNNSRTAHTGAIQYHSSVAKIPAAAVSAADADLLDRLFSRNLPVTLNLSIDNSESAWLPTYNLIATLPAAEETLEEVLLLTHIDSWDLGAGALDNGAGVGIILGVIKQLSSLQTQLKRNLKIVFVSSTMLSPIGIQAYVNQHQDSLANVVVATEPDMGSGNIIRLDTMVAADKLKYADYIHNLVADLTIERGHNQSAGGANSSYLLAQQVPIFNWVQDASQYFRFLHSANDTFDKISLESLQQNVAAYSIFVYAVASTDIDFRNTDLKRQKQTISADSNNEIRAEDE
ncbi:M28 family peptidase [Catenovulum sediminis]|uniref:M28 family peptidase n=1 Tax=Catenovulum sediminis TaxID=1740262 RepID=UPI001181474B|nr:M28 family peptidase [Catenovulum sediminis]